MSQQDCAKRLAKVFELTEEQATTTFKPFLENATFQAMVPNLTDSFIRKLLTKSADTEKEAE
jgi:hypothetical protein